MRKTRRLARTAKSWRSDTPTLVSSRLWCSTPRRRWRQNSRSPGRPRRKPLKPFARGMPERFRRTCSDYLRVFFSRKLRVRSSARHSLRPLKRGRCCCESPGESRGDVEVCLFFNVVPAKPTGRANARPMTGSACAGTHMWTAPAFAGTARDATPRRPARPAPATARASSGCDSPSWSRQRAPGCLPRTR